MNINAQTEYTFNRKHMEFTLKLEEMLQWLYMQKDVFPLGISTLGIVLFV